MGLTPSCDTLQKFVISNAANIQELPDVCYGSGHYVVVWTDLRDGINRVVRASRVTPQWGVLDTGYVVCSNSDYQISPVIAFDGTRYLTVWQDLAYPFGIQCRFIGGDGLPQGSVITLSSASSATNPRICHDGVNYLVVWQEYTTTNHIIGRLVSPDGSLIGDTIVITTGQENHVSPALCHDGDRFLITWAEMQIFGQFLTGTGSLIGPAFQISNASYEQVNPDVFFGGDKFLTVWSEFRTDYDIYGNMDVQGGVEDSNCVAPAKEELYPDRTVFVSRVEIIGAQGKQTSVFDALGKKIAETRTGVWEAGFFPSGVYFLSVDGQVIRVVKVR